MNAPVYRLRNLLRLFFLLLCVALFHACDVLQQDVEPDDPEIGIEGNEILTVSNGSAVIDLQSMIKTQGTVRLDISSQPRKGSLTELGKGILHYSTNRSFVQGRDGFRFLIFSEDNRLLKEDSVVIIVENDTTDLPCGIYPQNDYVQDSLSGPLVIDVLRNDVLCGDSTDMVVEVYSPEPNSPPYYGTAVVLAGNRILYTPNNSFAGSDKFVYKVYSPTDSAKVGFGIVYITPAPPCEFRLYDDAFVWNRDSVQLDTVRLNVFSNDEFCEVSVQHYHREITQGPAHGEAVIRPTHIDYILPEEVVSEVTDSLTYEICLGEVCKTAKVQIKIH